MESKAPRDALKICLYGKTGAGKSYLSNVIAQKELFKVGESLKSCTTGSSSHAITWPGMGTV